MKHTSQPSEKKDVYSIITDNIIAQLEKGVIPWRKPWAHDVIPQNLISKRAYQGINLWLLGMLGYEQNYFLTYKQVQELGGSVKQKETGHLVIYWKMNESKVISSADDNGEKSQEQKKHSILRYYTVFNIAQCENIPEDKLPGIVEHDNQPLMECEAIVNSMPNPPAIRAKEQEAYYHPGKDYINMPRRKSFNTSEDYYAVLFHELIHSTGHSSRLNRDGIQQMSQFGSTLYSTEEIIAEMGSCYLCAIAGIAPKPLENSVSYIKEWIERLKRDTRILIYAASQAQKAADYILVTPSEAVRNSEVAIEELG